MVKKIAVESDNRGFDDIVYAHRRSNHGSSNRHSNERFDWTINSRCNIFSGLNLWCVFGEYGIDVFNDRSIQNRRHCAGKSRKFARCNSRLGHGN